MPGQMSRVKFAPDVVVQLTGEEAVLLKLTEEVVFALNATAARVASLIVEGLAVPAIIDRLAAEYNRPRTSVSNDVQSLIETLVSKRLVDVDEQSVQS